ncbi:MAG: sigma-70 family RNA polymerase sigma factor [Chloroflexi bacterium]|nr:sigma-70 family RNA polymerase sigma factor [Chloroflexota bacterium]
MSSPEPATLTDEECAAQAQRRDRQSLALLYERYYDRVYRFALARIGNRADAEDLCQETFLKMVDKLETFRWQGVPFAAWLFRIAHNCVVDALRRRARRGQAVPLDTISLPAQDDPEQEVERSLAVQTVVHAMRRLTPAQQEVLSLRFGAGLSVAEAAKVLGKAEGTIKATQFQALQALRAMLEPPPERQGA